MNVETFMTRTPIACSTTDTVHDVARLMRDTGVGFIVVLCRGRVVGVITDRQITVGVTAEGLNAAILAYLYRAEKPWVYAYTVVHVATVLGVSTLLGLEILSSRDEGLSQGAHGVRGASGQGADEQDLGSRGKARAPHERRPPRPDRDKRHARKKGRDGEARVAAEARDGEGEKRKPTREREREGCRRAMPPWLLFPDRNAPLQKLALEREVVPHPHREPVGDQVRHA